MFTILVSPIAQAATYTYIITINGKTYVKTVDNVKDLPKNITVIDKITVPDPKVTVKPSPKPSPKPTPIVQKNKRVETGFNKTASFKAGESICGYKVVFDNGQVYENNVYIKNTLYGGVVTSGIINPNKEDIKDLKAIDLRFDKPDNATRQTSTGTLYYSSGTTLLAKEVYINGKTFYNVKIYNAPKPGYLFNGTIWPTAAELAASTFTLVDPLIDASQTHQRVVVPANSTLSFNKKDNVFGDIIIGDKLYQNTFIINANGDGKIVKGILYPLESDIPKDATRIIFP